MNLQIYPKIGEKERYLEKIDYFLILFNRDLSAKNGRFFGF